MPFCKDRIDCDLFDIYFCDTEKRKICCSVPKKQPTVSRSGYNRVICQDRGIIDMQYSEYRVTVIPALEKSTKYLQFDGLKTLEEARAVEIAVAHTLLFLQDDLRVMVDYSNIVTVEGKVNDEWEEVEAE